MTRFYVRDEEQHDALIEAVNATLRSWLNGEYTIEQQEEADRITSLCGYFKDKFSVYPRPVFWELTEGEVDMVKWILDSYLEETKVPLFGKKFKAIKALVREVKCNFAKAA